MESFNSFREKFCHLEVIYDRQTEEFKAELDKYKKNLEEQKRNEMSKVKEVNFIFLYLNLYRNLSKFIIFR